MSVNAPTFYAQQFATNIALLLQQKGSRLRMAVTEKSYVGEQASPVDQVGAVEMQEVVGRFAQMGRIDATLDRRWVLPSSFDLPQLIDSFDLLKMIVDPKSSYVENAVNAAGRQFDRLIIAAATGTCQTGKTGSTGTVLPAGQKVSISFGAGGNTNLTVAKLKETVRLMLANEVDLATDPLFMPLTASQHDSLLNEIQVVNKDYNRDAVLVEGKITRFMGINFLHTELLTTSAASTRVVPCWAKSGMHLGIWGDIQTDVAQRKDIQSLPWQVYVKMTAGATRIEEKKVVQVTCYEA